MKAIADPDEIRKFAASLEARAEGVRQRQTAMINSFHSLREVWRDEKYLRFERVLSHTITRLTLFYHRADAYARYLRKKAEFLDRYLDRRY
ncbi:hypothetical protein [Limisphaera sp. VF-2]|jgi:hypothetical protein|uniref:hypothetical protein n=1 Tax=Limisphaera sp. VF-2 TaxID=3400418 RepID=UPI003C28CB23